jgi:hypothetical protein
MARPAVLPLTSHVQRRWFGRWPEYLARIPVWGSFLGGACLGIVFACLWGWAVDAPPPCPSLGTPTLQPLAPRAG